ncbi:DEAD/DEAH box helicase [Motilibacter aurantiacus]|uniref:DEAD/DEAH box helicase n=1 Tax=Motilibacter aurantiacus TaxID=2714955 RepID=UPI001E33A8B2|nr:DEAD/DEAH box helicase [Motilibacter aurantiacus]
MTKHASSTPASTRPGAASPGRRAGRRASAPSASGPQAPRQAPTRRRAPEAAAPSPVLDDAVTTAAEAAPVTFAALGIPAPLVASLAAEGKTDAFPIQSVTLPDSLAGRDVLGRGATGSGKTLAFSLPIVARLLAAGTRRERRRPHALVLVPTRELANQVQATLDPLARAAGQVTAVVFGGVAQSRQEAALNAGVDILVACPGRLDDLIKQGVCDLSAVSISVLDEADHMADLGFLPVVRRILDQTPTGGQRLLFSATLDNGVDVLVKRFLTDPRVHAVAPAAAPVQTMEHHILEVAADAKGAIVRELASGTGRRVLFTRTKHQAKKLAKQLTASGVPAVDLQGNLAQNARERNLAAFTDGSVRVLVATDIAARGIHVDEIELVVHVDPPAEHKAYLHRSGRTARAGASGAVVTVMLPEQRSDVSTLLRQAKVTAPITRVAPGDATLSALVGERAPHVEPAPAPTAPAQQPARKAKVPGPRASGGGRTAGGRGQQPGAPQRRAAGSDGEATPAARRSRSRGGRGRGGRFSAA